VFLEPGAAHASRSVRAAARWLIFSGSLRFTMTETVTFDFGGVAFSRTELGAADFSLPAGRRASALQIAEA